MFRACPILRKAVNVSATFWKAVNTALGEVKGVTSNTAEKNATSFEIKGDFSPKEIFTALLFAAKPRYMHWMEQAKHELQLRI